MFRPVRVLPTKPPKGTFRVNVGWGVVGFIATMAIGSLLSYLYRLLSAYSFSSDWVFNLLNIVFLIPFLVIIGRIISRTSRLLPAVAGALGVMLGIMLAFFAQIGIGSPTLAGSIGNGLMMSAPALGVMFLGLLVVTLILYPIRHLRPGRLVAQTGLLCWCCAYDLTGLSEGTPCPECGHTPQVQIRWKPLRMIEHALGRWLVPLAVVGAVVGPVVYEILWRAEWLPTRIALRELGATEFVINRQLCEPIEASILSNSGTTFSNHGDAVVFPVKDHPRLVLVLVFPYSVGDGAGHAIELQVSARSNEHMFFSGGAFCLLTDEQAESVLESGVPSGLLDELIEQRGTFQSINSVIVNTSNTVMFNARVEADAYFEDRQPD